MSGKHRDLVGQKFGRLLVISYVGANYHRVSIWRCRCECGKEVELPSNNFTRGNTKSCGCFRSDYMRQRETTHGLHKSREYAAFLNARKRCEDPDHISYRNYGGRGIRFLFEKFEQWRDALGSHPGKGFTVDRINNAGHYEPGNVRWATRSEQERNKRPMRPRRRREAA
jgi:hypothetical protein